MAITNQNLFDYISLTVHSGPGGGQKPKKYVFWFYQNYMKNINKDNFQKDNRILEHYLKNEWLAGAMVYGRNRSKVILSRYTGITIHQN